MSFRVSAEKRPISANERELMTRAETRALSVEDRLAIVAESMLMYANWFPAFGAFDLALLNTQEENQVADDGAAHSETGERASA